MPDYTTPFARKHPADGPGMAQGETHALERIVLLITGAEAHGPLAYACVTATPLIS